MINQINVINQINENTPTKLIMGVFWLFA